MDKKGAGKLALADLHAFGAHMRQRRAPDPAVEEAMAKAEMEHYDTDGDGKVSPAEFGELTEGAPEEEEDMFSKLDADEDGSLDVREMTTWISGRFFEENHMVRLVDAADADKDGFVTLQELLDCRLKEEAQDLQLHFQGWAHELEL